MRPGAVRRAIAAALVVQRSARGRRDHARARVISVGLGALRVGRVEPREHLLPHNLHLPE